MNERESLVAELRRALEAKASGVAVDEREFSPENVTIATEQLHLRPPKRARGIVAVAADRAVADCARNR